MDGADPCFTVVLPVYREAENLKECISSICAQLGDLGSFEILAVDDGSPDNSWQVITQLSEDNPLVRGIRFSRNFGKESAISAGLAHARGQAVVIMDADLQHPPELLPQMIRLWRDDKYDVVDAVKVARGKESKLRRLMAALFTRLMCRLTGFNLAGSSDFKLLDRRAVRAWLQLDERLTFYRGMTEWIGFRHTQVPFEVKERAGGATSWSYCELLSLGSNAIVSFSSIPLHLVTFFGLVFCLLSAVMGVYSLVVWAIGSAVSGFTTVILLQLAIGSVILLSLGIFGLYISGIYRELKERPRFVVAEETGTAPKYARPEEIDSARAQSFLHGCDHV